MEQGLGGEWFAAEGLDALIVTDLVNVLNELGVSPKDLTAIFQSLKSAGALEGDLVVN